MGWTRLLLADNTKPTEYRIENSWFYGIMVPFGYDVDVYQNDYSGGEHKSYTGKVDN